MTPERVTPEDYLHDILQELVELNANIEKLGLRFEELARVVWAADRPRLPRASPCDRAITDSDKPLGCTLELGHPGDCIWA